MSEGWKGTHYCRGKQPGWEGGKGVLRSRVHVLTLTTNWLGLLFRGPEFKSSIMLVNKQLVT